MKKPVLYLLIVLFVHSAGCSLQAGPEPRLSDFSSRLGAYPETGEPLLIARLSGASVDSIRIQNPAPDVFIMVHPAYSLFFREEKKSFYREGKFKLLSLQFENEARFIAEAGRSGQIVILIVPGKYETDSVSPYAYTSYLNDLGRGAVNMFYLASETSSSGSISVQDIVELYRFLEGVKAGKVLMGGGYIGRCQRESYRQLTSYMDKTPVYIVPEISTISPDDISESEASDVLAGIRQQDYSPVRKFMDRKLDEEINLLSLPQRKSL